MAKPGGAGVPPIGSFGVSDNGNDKGVFTRLNFVSTDGKPVVGPTNEATQTATVTVQGGATVYSQSVVYINAVTGSDSNSGSAPNKPLKTWAAFAAKIGQWGIVKSSNGRIDVFLQTDLPESDPITLLAILDGTNIFVHGTRTIKASGTFSAVTLQANATNTPWSVTDASKPNAFWADKIGDIVFLPLQGGRTTEGWAVVTKDLGAKNATTGEWAEDDGSGTFTQPTQAPAVGNNYQVLRLSTATIGLVCLGTTDRAPPNQFPPISLFVLQDINFPSLVQGDPSEFTALGACLGGAEQDGGCTVLFRCRIDQPVYVPSSVLGGVIAGCSFTQQMNVYGTLFIGWGQTFIQSINGNYPGAVLCQGGSRIFGDGVTCQGNLLSGAVSDFFLVAGSQVRLGQIGFNDCFHGFALAKGSTLETGEGLYGTSFQPWGVNVEPVFMEMGSNWQLFDFSGTFPVPTLDNTATPGVPIVYDDQSPTNQSACTFNTTTSGYTQDFTVAWSKLLVAPPMGGLFFSSASTRNASFLHPVTGTNLLYTAF